MQPHTLPPDLTDACLFPYLMYTACLTMPRGKSEVGEVEEAWPSLFPSLSQSICLENSHGIPGRRGRSADRHHLVEKLQFLLMWDSVEDSNRIRGRWSRSYNTVTCKSTAHTNCRIVAFMLTKSLCLGKVPHPDGETWSCH